jgi:hypothetical protein
MVSFGIVPLEAMGGGDSIADLSISRHWAPSRGIITAVLAVNLSVSEDMGR